MEFILFLIIVGLLWVNSRLGTCSSKKLRNLRIELQIVKDSKEAGWNAASRLDSKCDDLVDEYNSLIDRINAHGGESLFSDAYHKETPDEQFTQEELLRLLKLCHPDKHNNSDNATKLTQKILSMRYKEE